MAPPQRRWYLLAYFSKGQLPGKGDSLSVSFLSLRCAHVLTPFLVFISQKVQQHLSFHYTSRCVPLTSEYYQTIFFTEETGEHEKSKFTHSILAAHHLPRLKPSPLFPLAVGNQGCFCSSQSCHIESSLPPDPKGLCVFSESPGEKTITALGVFISLYFRDIKQQMSCYYLLFSVLS